MTFTLVNNGPFLFLIILRHANTTTHNRAMSFRLLFSWWLLLHRFRFSFFNKGSHRQMVWSSSVTFWFSSICPQIIFTIRWCQIHWPVLSSIRCLFCWILGDIGFTYCSWYLVTNTGKPVQLYHIVSDQIEETCSRWQKGAMAFAFFVVSFGHSTSARKEHHDGLRCYQYPSIRRETNGSRFVAQRMRGLYQLSATYLLLLIFINVFWLDLSSSALFLSQILPHISSFHFWHYLASFPQITSLHVTGQFIQRRLQGGATGSGK